MIVFGHEFEYDSTGRLPWNAVCRNCKEKLQDAAQWCPFRPSLGLELEVETLP